MTGTKRPLSGEKEVSQCKRARSIRNNIQSSQVNKILFKNLRNQQISQQISQQMLVKYSKNFVSLIFSVLPNIFCVYFHLIISFYILTFLIKCVQVLKRIPKFKIKFPEVHQLPSESAVKAADPPPAPSPVRKTVKKKGHNPKVCVSKFCRFRHAPVFPPEVRAVPGV